MAVGDVHGDLERLIEILRHAGLAGEDGGWAGEDASLVLLGDLIDRGPDSRGVLELAMRLSEQAPGDVRALLGNHEVMNLVGDLRYVPAEEYADYVAPGAEELLEARYRSYAEFLRARARRLGFEEPAPDAVHRLAWLEAHPPGFFERRAAFAPEGRYGRWLRTLDAALLRDRVLFVHGGVSESRPFPSVEALNETVRRELSRFDELWGELGRAGVLWPDLRLDEALQLVTEELALWDTVDSLPAERLDPAALEHRPDDETLRQMRELAGYRGWAIAAEDGPLWYRGLVTEPEEALVPVLEPTLERFGAVRAVVGHTPARDGRVRVRAGGRVVAADTGISSAIGGRASAVEIEGSRVRALYPGEAAVVLVEPEGGAAGDGAAASPAGAAEGAAGAALLGGVAAGPDDAAAGEVSYDALRGLPLERIEGFCAPRRSLPSASWRRGSPSPRARPCRQARCATMWRSSRWTAATRFGRRASGGGSASATATSTMSPRTSSARPWAACPYRPRSSGGSTAARRPSRGGSRARSRSRR